MQYIYAIVCDEIAGTCKNWGNLRKIRELFQFKMFNFLLRYTVCNFYNGSAGIMKSCKPHIFCRKSAIYAVKVRHFWTNAAPAWICGLWLTMRWIMQSHNRVFLEELSYLCMCVCVCVLPCMCRCLCVNVRCVLVLVCVWCVRMCVCFRVCSCACVCLRCI